MARCSWLRPGIVAFGCAGVLLLSAPRARAQEDFYDLSADYLRVWDGLTQAIEAAQSSGGASEAELRSLRTRADEAKRKAAALQRALDRLVRQHRVQQGEAEIDARVTALLRATPASAEVIRRSGGGYAVLTRAGAELQSVPSRVDRLLGRATRPRGDAAETAGAPTPGLKCVLLGAHVVASALEGASAARESQALPEACDARRP